MMKSQKISQTRVLSILLDRSYLPRMFSVMHILLLSKTTPMSVIKKLRWICLKMNNQLSIGLTKKNILPYILTMMKRSMRNREIKN